MRQGMKATCHIRRVSGVSRAALVSEKLRGKGNFEKVFYYGLEIESTLMRDEARLASSCNYFGFWTAF